MTLGFFIIPVGKTTWFAKRLKACWMTKRMNSIPATAQRAIMEGEDQENVRPPGKNQ